MIIEYWKSIIIPENNSVNILALNVSHEEYLKLYNNYILNKESLLYVVSVFKLKVIHNKNINFYNNHHVLDFYKVNTILFDLICFPYMYNSINLTEYMIISFRLLKAKGFLIIYNLPNFKDNSIDFFIKCFSLELECVHFKDNEIFIRKI